MDVREKLVEMLSEIIDGGFKWHNYCYESGEQLNNDEIASYLIAHGVTVQEWISVKDRLPKLIPCSVGTAYSEAVNVLTSDRKVITAIWDGTEWIGPFGFWDAEGEEITHWAPVLLPLPQPPKGE